jgi:hypothetical protein
MAHYFTSSDKMGYNPLESTHINLGMTGYLFHQRPTALLGWNDPDEWYDRLVYDEYIANLLWEKVISKTIQHGRPI